MYIINSSRSSGLGAAIQKPRTGRIVSGFSGRLFGARERDAKKVKNRMKEDNIFSNLYLIKLYI